MTSFSRSHFKKSLTVY
uniref:Uncharacterized protein n=1 Tax=Anguilla anguilla TaxID=7936 RepID=A0A0E9V452_ANGAN